MKISKSLASCLIISCMSVAITSCNSSSSGVYRGSLYSETSTTTSPSPEPVKAPEVYDVICFQAMGLGVGRTMCSPDQTYKVSRNTQVTVYLKKETSVQQGTNTIVAFKYKDKNNNGELQKITVSEMESLASEGANVYTMYYHNVPVMLSNSQPFVEVELFNKDLGSFKMFDQDKTQVVFETGDTKVRVALPQRKEGLMGDMQAVQNGGIYRKIVTTTQPATGATGGKLDVTDKVKLVPLKTSLVMTNTAIEGGDIDKAKTMFNKFSSLWLTVEPIVKAKAGDKYPAIEKDIAMIKTAMGEANPDKAKAGEGLTAVIQGFNELMK